MRSLTGGSAAPFTAPRRSPGDGGAAGRSESRACSRCIEARPRLLESIGADTLVAAGSARPGYRRRPALPAYAPRVRRAWSRRPRLRRAAARPRWPRDRLFVAAWSGIAPPRSSAIQAPQAQATGVPGGCPPCGSLVYAAGAHQPRRSTWTVAGVGASTPARPSACFRC